MKENQTDWLRYERQMQFPQLGLAGQKKLLTSKVLIVGVGGLGSWAAELLARAGVGLLRLVDDDKVDCTNIHRQAMYDLSDAKKASPKVQSAASHIGNIDSSIQVEPIEKRLDKNNISTLAEGMNLILDGTDNFTTRYIINDYAIKRRVPWVFGGVVGAEAQTMTIVPSRTACLRCIHDTPPPPCVDPNCRIAGVLGPAVATIASIQALEAIKVLLGAFDAINPYLLKLDFWTNTIQRIELAQACKNVDCVCCKQKHFEFLDS